MWLSMAINVAINGYQCSYQCGATVTINDKCCKYVLLSSAFKKHIYFLLILVQPVHMNYRSFPLFAKAWNRVCDT